MRMLLRTILAAGGLFLAPPAAWAVDSLPDDLCLGNPCVVTGTHVLEDGTIFDFADRDLVIQGIVDIGGGGFGVDVLAGSITIAATGQIRGRGGLSVGGGTLALLATRNIQILGALTGGAIDLTGADGGGLTINSLTGSVTGSGRIDVSAMTSLGVGGAIDVSAGSAVNLSGVVVAESLTTGSGAGGFITVTASSGIQLAQVDLRGGSSGGGTLDALAVGDITLGTVRAQGMGPVGGPSVGGMVTVSGAAVSVGSVELFGQAGGGGLLDVDATGSATVATVNADGSGAAGNGGVITIASVGALTLQGSVSARGSTSGGSGGGVSLTAAGGPGSSSNVTVSGPVQLEGRGGGSGGDFGAIGDTVLLAGNVSAANLASDGSGGFIDVHARALLRVTGTLLAGGGTVGIGLLQLSSDGAMELLGPARANGAGAGAGGGLVSATAGGALKVATALSANSGTAADGGGGVILSGCSVAVDPGSVVEAKGADGSISSASGSSMTLRGTYTGGTGGEIGLRYGIATTPPNLAGAAFSPAPTQIFDPTQKPCAEQCGALDADLDGRGNGCDNCPFTANPGQQDVGGVGPGSAPDGIGDACQCGDVDGNGRVTLSDAVQVSRSRLSPPTATLARPAFCDVGASAGCSLSDAVILRRALLAPPTATIQQQCPAAVQP